MDGFFATLTPWWPPGRADLRGEPLRQWLAGHPPRAVTFTARELSLVAQTHDGAGAMTWRVLGAVPLTG
jgi:hypothetical protein